MKNLVFLCLLWSVSAVAASAEAVADDALPFQHKIEVFRDAQNDVIVFRVQLEQPFLAEEFEKSNYLRLKPTNDQAYLIYPKETTFHQKHAEFYGRLRGEGSAKLKLSYEMVSENLDGSRRIDVRQSDIEVPVPPRPEQSGTVGPKSIFTEWAQQQNIYFTELLRYYPEETFYQYCLLQSQARYGVTPPPLPNPAPDRMSLETSLYQVVTGSAAIQDALQRKMLSATSSQGALNIHISTLQPPAVQSLPYKELLDKKRTEEKVEPAVAEITRLVPEDQYFLQFNSMPALDETIDLATQWGNNLLQLFTVRAQDQQLQAKFEDQLCLRRDPLTKLFADAVISEVCITGADPFVVEGADLTVIFGLKQPEVFEKAAASWREEVRKKYSDMTDQEFNYRGHKIKAYYSKDRVVSCFTVRHQGYAIFSNSHRAIRQVIDTLAGISPSLHDALDYRYVTTILAPSQAGDSGYFFCSEAMIRRLVAPAAKISEKRRIQCFNNLVMLNNASLFYRMEYGRSPASLSELSEGRFIDPQKIVCPHGGAYAFDAAHDNCTCSLHNRLKYLTPNAELTVLNVSKDEAAEYDRYKARYEAFWQKAFDPIAMRITAGPRMKLETCVLPFSNGSFYRELRAAVDKNAKPMSTAQFAPSAIVSLAMTPGRAHAAEMLRSIPGVAETLQANPTLTDLKWLGDRIGLHYCDGATILEIDPTQLQPTNVPFVGNVPVEMQGMVAALLASVNMPVYATLDVENRENAARLLEELSQQIFLKQGQLMPGLSTRFDAYRMPDYKEHPIYVYSGQLYAVKIRLHVAVVGDQLVAATKPEILREVIDANQNKDRQPPQSAHILVRLNRHGMKLLRNEVQLYWAEKSRIACHRNIISIYNLCKLYHIPVAEVPRLSEAKYGVRYYCPDDGAYGYDAERDEVSCSIHGNRKHSMQHPPADRNSSFDQFIDSLDEVVASLKFQDDALITTVEIARTPGKRPPATPTAKE